MRSIRVVFEKGLEMRCDESGVWSFLPSRTTQANLALSTITHGYTVRPVLMAEEHPSGKELMSLFSTEGRQAPNAQLHLDNIPAASLATPFRSLRYIVGAVSYHCERLANLYAETWRSFHRLQSASLDGSNIVHFAQYGFQEECYYDFDALLTAAIRCYETMRFPLWNVFGAKDGIAQKRGPRKNFEDTLNVCEHLPPALSDRLKQSWVRFGIKAKSYRDFIQHYFPLDRGFSQAKMERLDKGVWSASMLVPDNPEDKSPRNFRYDCKIDALTYGWELTNEILQVTELLAVEIHNAYNSQVG